MNYDPITLVAATLCGLSLFMLLHSYRRSSSIRDLREEIENLKDREQEIQIRIGDALSKVNNLVTAAGKQSHILEKKLQQLEERFQHPTSSQSKLFEIESEFDLDVRVKKIEEVLNIKNSKAAQQPPKKEEKKPEPKKEEGASLEVKAPVILRKSFEEVLKKSREQLAEEVKIVCSQVGLKREFLEGVKTLLKKNSLEFCSDHIFEEDLTKISHQAATEGSGVLEARLLLAPLIERILHKTPMQAPGTGANSQSKELRTILLVGGPGSGKTRAALGMADLLKSIGKKVLVSDCVTGSEGQHKPLSEVAKGSEIPFVSSSGKSKPQSVAYKSIHRAQDQKCDAVILDTPAVLDAKRRINADVTQIAAMIARELPHPPHETLLVLSSFDIKNALLEAEVLLKEGSFSGLYISHLDKSPTPQAVLSMSAQLGVPIWYLGLGEHFRDTAVFDVRAFVKALFGISVAIKSDSQPAQSPIEHRTI